MKKRQRPYGVPSILLIALLAWAPTALAQNPPWQIHVTSQGASGVTIGSNNGYGGVTDYFVYDIPDLTQVNLQAPLSSGGKNFYQWQGCTSTSAPSGSTCNVTMTANWSVNAVYVDGYQLNVNSGGVSGVAISSTTGHGGTTNYSLVLSQFTGVSLQAPVDLGSSVFYGWSGCDSTNATTCNLNMSSHKTVNASYIFAGSRAEDFVTTWRTDNPGITSDTSILVPMVGSPYLVDWNNDGTFDEFISDGSVLHNFGAAGIYTIRIWGSYDSIRFDNVGDKEKILSLDQWGSNAWATMSDAFRGASNLTVPATDIPDFSDLTDLSNMFFQATSANPDTSGWNTSTVTDMSGIFALTDAADPDTGSWDTSSVTSMSRMFDRATAANPDTSGWDTSSVTNMSSVFAGTILANPDTSGWDTSSVTDMRNMFYHSTAANPDTSGWDTSAVTSMSWMFREAQAANPDTSGWDTSVVTDMGSMFRSADAANPDTSGWDTSSVTDTHEMFFDADAANPDTSGWDTSAVTNMSAMFLGADVANPNTSGWDTSSVTDMSGMFGGAPSANPDTSGWDTSSVTDMSSMFSNAPLANPDISGWDTSNVTQMGQMFKNASAFNRDVGAWNVTALEDAAEMFDGLTLPVAHYDSLLTGWNAQALQSGVSFGGGGSHYCSAAAIAARANMVSSDGWTINDGGQACPPPNPTQAPDLTPETDTGVSDSDDITSNRTPSFYVECFAAGDTVTLYTDNPSPGTTFGTHPCSGTGTEAATAMAVLRVGIHDITYTVTNIVAESAHSPALQVTTTTVPGAPEDDFVTTWDTWRIGGASDTSIVLPMIGGPYDVDWDNDGSFDQFGIIGSVLHDFGSRNVFTVRIRGRYDAFRFSDFASGIRELISIDQWGTGQWKSMESAFRGAWYLVVNAIDTPDFSAVVSMRKMFEDAFLADPDTSGWDTSSVTDMLDMFRNASVANPNTSGWDTSSVTNMLAMFEGATSANPDTSGWNTSSVIYMRDMFANASSANPDTSGWDTSSVRNMSGMFEGATSANPNTGGWDTSSVTNMSRMFTGAVAANPDTSGWDTSSVTTTSHMFEGAVLANPDTSGWNTSSVSNMSYMFQGATAANPDTSGWDTSNVTYMHYLFDGATAFDRDLGAWDVTALTNATGMLDGVILSTANYENLLIGWDAQALHSGVSFSGGNSTYCSAAAHEARTHMIEADSWSITDAGQVCSSCNVVSVSGVTEQFDALHEACEILVLGPDFIATDGVNIEANSGWEIMILPGFGIQQGASFNGRVCGQSLCTTSPSPMPYGCHSCVDQICDIDASCCALEFDQACRDRVSTVCGLVCE